MDILSHVQDVLDLLRTFPWLLLLLVAVPLIVLARWKKIYPSRILIAVVGFPCLLSLAMLIWPDTFLIVGLIDLFVILVAAIDLFRVPGVTAFTAERNTMLTASLDKPHSVSLVIDNTTNQRHELTVRDDRPDEFEQTPSEFHVTLDGRSRATLTYQLRSLRRGSFILSRVYLRVVSRGRLWVRYLTYPVTSRIHVYPDMRQLSEYAILARTNRLALMGVRRTRKIGQDNEFERLRDYSLDDNYKHIDWRASARRSKLTVRDFQVNQSQRLIFMIDSGRMMTNTVNGISLLDHAFNAMLMLSYVALKQGDSVGMLCFSDRIHSFVPPQGGLNQMNRMLHASFDQFPQLVESRYDEAFLYLSAHCKKRSLVILITNVIDQVNSNQIQQYLRSMSGKHLPMGVLLRDRALFAAADAIQPDGRDLYRAAAAANILTWRHQVLADMQHNGVLSVDAFPEELTAPLVNRYLEVKERHLL